jgi:hypothetical protein
VKAAALFPGRPAEQLVSSLARGPGRRNRDATDTGIAAQEAARERPAVTIASGLGYGKKHPRQLEGGS